MRILRAVLCVAVFAPQVFAEEITMTTYYPSPRGVYTELRAGSLEAMDRAKPFSWDLESGVLTVSSVELIDAATGKKYRLGIADGKLAVTDLAEEKRFMLIELDPQPAARGKQR